MIEQTLRELLEDKVAIDIEGIDRLYLNAYQPRLQSGGGGVGDSPGNGPPVAVAGVVRIDPGADRRV